MIDCIPAEQTTFNKLKRNLLEKIYKKLNTEQKEAVLTTEGPLLLLAGAGSGKTTVLINRIANLMRFGSGSDSYLVPDTVTDDDVYFLEELKELLGLEKTPEYIESYDISHTGGSDNVAGMIVFKNGRPLKRAYRTAELVRGDRETEIIVDERIRNDLPR